MGPIRFLTDAWARKFQQETSPNLAAIGLPHSKSLPCGWVSAPTWSAIPISQRNQSPIPTMIPDKHSTATDLARFLASMGKRIGKLARLHSDAEEQIDEIECDFAEVAKVYAASPAAILRSRGPKHHSPAPTAEQQRILQAQAKQGAIAVRIETPPTGAASAQIDGRAPVPLTPLMADLLAILSADNCSSNDHLVGWKSFSDISCSMTKRTGKTFTRHAVSQLICRLKERLREFGENKFLIQQNPRFGYRFALRRSPERVTDGDQR
jgi:hypothetical protein